MKAVTKKLVTVFGGSGFVGRHLVRQLAQAGLRVRVAVRRPDLAQFLMTTGAVGQVNAVQANLRYPASVAAAVRGADVVVNLVGILNNSGHNTFDAVQVFGARTVAQAAAEAGVSTLVHMSALGVDVGDTAYARTKREGEKAVREAFPGAIITRPSVIFGPEDDFLNKIAALARMSPIVPLIGSGGTRLQPVFVGDVAEVITRAVCDRIAPGTTYELGGAEVMTMREITELVERVTNRNRFHISLPFGLAGFLANFAQFAPGKPLTPDQVTMLKRDSVVSAEAEAEGCTLGGLGIVPSTIEAEAPVYLWRFRKTGQFEKLPV